jgi:gliding motility-associated-like protein
MRTSPVKPYDNAVIDSCSGAHIILNAQNPGKNFLWSNGQTSQVTTVTDSGFYYVIISDSAGYCPITDGVTVITPSCQQCQIAIPTAFSPNNDGRNDLFRVFFECQPESYLIAVYDRWGQLIYQSDNLTDGWDGYYRNIPQPIGVYTYFIHYREAGTKADKSMTGNITLLR